ncbi:hypothetical protein DM02DRAFT_696474 [Periconia macrospinosa]|uniref:Rhodanese domain-containing protein n=1 Tax=Periconia macrospinosa TaxID=97972 RepID=A0A2V1ECQ1_9PLEO|nr:hypothetical protein DM02DRAFT_696474 [Periconia macrospinosa]
MPRTILIDVRTPTECLSTGLLSLPHSSNNNTITPPTMNIEYTQIASLPVISQRDHSIEVRKDDRILLYCRSGRRSGIARGTLMQMGFDDVSDLGGFEEARGWLERERKREDESGKTVVEGGGKEGGEEGKRRMEKRVKGFEGLVAGLKELE